jgi:hypothetical protein
MAESHGHHDSSRHDILLDVATPQLYRANAFRVLGLSVTVDGAEMSRQQKKLKMLEKLGGAAAQNHSGTLPLIPPPDSEELRRAGQRLHDMQSRIVDELFWFWPADHANGDADAAYKAACEGQLRDAHQLWCQQKEQSETEAVAVHNLAVLHHALALDIEHASNNGNAGDAPADPKVQARRDKYWAVALEHWAAFAGNESGWSYILSRAEVLDDPRLTSGFVRRLRHSLPEAILSININLAVRAAKRGDVDEAKRHLLYVRNSGFDLHLAASLLEREASPLVEHVRRICDPVADRSKASPEAANQLAKSVLDDCQVLLTGIRAILGKEHHLRQTAFDLVASTVRGCMIDYGNATEDWSGCVPLLKQAATLALDSALQSRLQDDLNQVEENRKGKENERSLVLVNKAVEAAKAGRPDDGRRMLNEALAVCKDPDLRQTISGLITRIDEARQEAARQRNAGCLTELFGRVIGIGVLIGVIALIGWLVDSCDSKPSRSYSPPRSSTPSPTYTPPRQSTPSRSYTGLSSRIDAGKARAGALESEISQMDSQLESLSSSIGRYKREIEGYESQARSGLRVNQYSYEQALGNHNRLVEQYNALLVRRNAKYSQYEQEIDSVNDMVNRYNRGER